MEETPILPLGSKENYGYIYQVCSISKLREYAEFLILQHE